MFPLMRRKPPGPLNILEQEELHYLRMGVYLYKLKVDLGVQPLRRLGDLCMRTPKYYLYLTDEEYSLVLQSLVSLKNNLIREDRYTDAVDELIIKLSKAKKKKVRIV